MSLTLAQFNTLPQEEAVTYLLTCCTSTQWAQNLANTRPFADLDALLESSDAIWHKVQNDEANLLEAFDGHPQIGNVASLKEKYRNTQSSAAHEQSGANDAADEVLEALARGNQDYLDKFGFIFIVFATGKSAQQMLDLLLARLPNGRAIELANAATEQNKITRLRLNKLLGSA
ncbi:MULTISPECIES: 2-oxo-4-hydroxy-4-carboxy-5-ureidoimidazoline decarboxylase [unclassified Psychrobacter]|uniref:2-oxo-4-hydroxy-4-carboxy-5-ureidoimidazoline decarboxylase n=1 Tax=unclassified Psychrobacter TaxID=196806 RepID=UPI003FB9E385